MSDAIMRMVPVVIFFVGSFHNIIIGISVALILFIVGSNMGKPIDDKTGKLFFPEKY